MRILIDCRLLDKKRTGISNFIEKLILSYEKDQDYKKIILLANDKSTILKFRSTKIEILEIKYRTYLIHHILYLSNYLTKLNLDLIHFPTYVGVFYKKKNTKILYTVHDIFYSFIPNFFSNFLVVNYIKKTYFNLIINLSLRISNRIFSVSKTTQKDLLKKFNLKSKVIYHGFDNNFLENKSPIKKKKYYLYVGNLRAQKNIKLLIDVFSKNTDKQLKIAGNYKSIPYKKYPKNIEFIGYQSDDNLRKLYMEAKAFIFPSLYEGFGLPILEAISNKTIVFSSDRGSLIELKNKNIHYFNPEYSTELEALIKKEDYIFYNEEIEFLSKKFNWSSNLKTMHEIIKNEA